MTNLTTKVKEFERVDIGSLNNRIAIYDRSIAPPTADDDVNFTEIFTPKLACWACIETTGSIDMFDGANVVRAISHVITIRNVNYSTVLDNPVFTGVGNGSFTLIGEYANSYSVRYVIEMDSTNTFRWSDNNGINWVEERVQLTADAHVLNNGLALIFDLDKTYYANDKWEFKAKKGCVISSQDWIYYKNKFMPFVYLYEIMKVNTKNDDGRYLELYATLTGDQSKIVNWA